MNYWLFKSEPECFSWSDLLAKPDQTAPWDGVRNYQARNFMKSMKKGDKLFFYHSVVVPQVICGIAEVAREAYPDFTQFDPQSQYFDSMASPDNVRWWMVDVKAVKEFAPAIERDEIKSRPDLAGMELLKKGSRLSIQPVTEAQWKTICAFRT